MSDIWIPGQSKPKAIHTEKINACVLVHHETKRILTFCFKDVFAESFLHAGYELIELKTAHDYDVYAQRAREQSKQDNEIEQYKQLEREAPVRKRLREQLQERVRNAPNAASRFAARSALTMLDRMEEKKKRTFESYLLNEAVESTKGTAGEDLVQKIIGNK